MLLSGLTSSLQKQTPLKSRNKRALDTFEEATEKGKYDYWLTQEDIADIARIEYNAFKFPSLLPNAYTFEILGSIRQLTVELERLQSPTQLAENRLTLIINLSSLHWVTLVISRRYSAYDGFYIDSQGNPLPDEYFSLLRRFNIAINDFSTYFSQQKDSFNCGLWALENAADLNKMLDETKPFDWLIKQFQRPRNYYYFNTVRRILVQKFYLDVVRHERLYRNTLQPESESLEKNDASSLLAQEDPTPKRMKVQLVDKADLETRLEEFVESFISHFQKKIIVYQIIARGEKLSIDALKQELKTSATGALFGFIFSRGLMGTIPSLIFSLRTMSSRYYVSKKKAQKLIRVFSRVNLVELSNIVIEAAVEIFKSYEAQFMNVTDKAGDKIAMQKLGEDAVARVMNYISEQRDVNYISVSYITRAAIFGNSDKYFDPSLNKFRLSSLGNAIKDEYDNAIYTADLFEKVGLAIFTTKAIRFYKKVRLAEIEQYGYRNPLRWETTTTNILIGEYAQNYEQIIPSPQIAASLQRDLRDYRYILHTVSAQTKAQSLLERIRNRLQITSTLKKAEKKSIMFKLRAPVENFVGREQVLSELHQTLLWGKTTTIVSAMSGIALNTHSEIASGSHASVSGLGGIGKTQVALRYAQLYAEQYDNNVLWISSETKLAISQDFIKLANKLKIETKDKYGESKDIESIVEEIYEYFSDRKSLFIFDNVENYVELEPFLPKLMVGNKPYLLITSRYRNWGNAAPVISLDVFTEQEALFLIKQGLSIEDDVHNTKINELNHLLQGLPLAIQQAVSYIKLQRNRSRGFNVGTYIEIFKVKSREILDFNFRLFTNDPYFKTAYTTWQVTLDLIRKEGPVGEAAIEILNIISFIGPENIHMEKFALFYSPTLLTEAVQLLISYSMANLDTVLSDFFVHRLVQKVVHLQLQNDAKRFREVAIKAESIVIYFANNMDNRFHYIYFLFNVLEHPELERYLKYKSSFQRIASILMVDDMKMWLYFFDVAYTRFNKLRYVEFLTEAFFNYRSLAAAFYLATMLDYMEKKFLNGILTKGDIKNIIDNEDFLGCHNRHRTKISAIPEKRELQLYIAKLIDKFKAEFFFEQSVSCSSERKKRSLGISCLQKKQAQKEEREQKTIRHLENVRHVARFVSTGLFAKDTMAAILRGDFSSVAINFSLLLSGKLFGSLSNALLAQGEKLITDESALLQKDLTLENKAALDIFLHEDVILSGKRKLLSKTIKMAAPFIARGTSIFFAYNLITDIQKYKSGDTHVLSSIVSNGAIVAIDGVEASIETAELLEIITGVSEFTGPIGEGVAVLIWLGAEGYEAYKGVDAIEKYVDLTLSDKFIQGLRLFFAMGPSEYIELKAKNNQLLQHALSFLKEHREVKRYVFSASSIEADAHIPSEVQLNNKFNLTLSESMPDVPSDAQLFCVSGTRTATHLLLHLVSQNEAFNRYFCKKAIGIEYSVNRTGDATLIALNKGDDKAIVVSQTPTIFLVNEGNKTYKGNDKSNLFFILGNHVTGTLEGGNGIDLMFLNNFYTDTNASALIDRQGFLCAKNLSLYDIIPRCDPQHKVVLKNINQIYGRPNKKDVLYLTKHITLVDGKGGESEASPDIIYVTSESEQDLKIIIRANTRVKYIDANLAPYPINHIIPKKQQGKAQIDFPFRDNIQLRFFFDYYFENLTAIAIDNHRLQFNLSSAQSVDFQNETFSLILQNSFTRFSSNVTMLPENAYYFFKDNIQIKTLDENHIYVKEESSKKLDDIIDSFIVAANRLKKTFTVQLSHNQTVSIGQEKNEILITNCLAESYLIGNGGENVYVVSPLNTTLFPLPEVTLYDVGEEEREEFRDTLDLREVVKKVNGACPGKTLSVTLQQEGNDLVMRLNTFYYPLNQSQECIQSDTQWTVISVRFKKAIFNEWYQKLDVLLEDDKPQVIQYNVAKGWYLIGESITFGDDKEIIVITNKDISQNSELVFLKDAGNFTFLNRNETDLIITNSLDANTSSYYFYTIVCSQFYKLAEMRKKVLSLTFLFLDHALSLKNYEEQINTTIQLSSVLESHQLFTNSSVLALASDTQSRISETLANSTKPGMRDKRQANHEFEKSVASNTSKIFPPFYELFNWVKKQGRLIISIVNNYIQSGSDNKPKLLTQKIKYQEKMTKKFYSKWNKSYKQEGFFTQTFDQKTKNIPFVRETTNFCLKQQINYKKVVLPESNVPSLHQDTQFHSGIFSAQVTLNININETLVFADFLFRKIGKK